MTHTILPSQAANSNSNSNSVDIDGVPRKVDNIGMQVIASGLNSSDSTVKLQHSNDETNWQDITDATITLASGSSQPVLTPIANIGMRFYRIVFTKNTNSAGTLSVILNFN